jgi:hypothetical protein
MDSRMRIQHCPRMRNTGVLLQGWRLELIDEFSTHLLQAIGTAHDGKVAPAHAPRVIADGGGRGVGAVSHVSFQSVGDDVIESTVYYDVGSTVGGQFWPTRHQDNIMVNTTTGQTVVGKWKS